VPWRALVVEVEAGRAEALADALLARGAASVAIEDADAGTAAEQAVFDEPGAAAGAWRRARLRALVDPALEAGDLLRAAAAAAALARVPPHALETVDDTDWVRASQAEFAPIRVTERLWVVPTWHAAPDPAALNIVLDPGLAFGTGSHPTTRLCLRWLERHVTPGLSVLDYGTGSGILAIAACKLGAGTVVGVDIDPAAVGAARANAALNRVGAQFREAAMPVPLVADLVVANILANPLALLAPALAAHTRPGGRIALAGLLEPQGAAVAAAYAPWFDLAVFGAEDGWIALEGVRRCA
jgi:ribosomal protein L11 methyltransferase